MQERPLPRKILDKREQQPGQQSWSHLCRRRTKGQFDIVLAKRQGRTGKTHAVLHMTPPHARTLQATNHLMGRR